jgi:FKBP-type peptidyl-prolyl cis-trans isomerase
MKSIIPLAVAALVAVPSLQAQDQPKPADAAAPAASAVTKQDKGYFIGRIIGGQLKEQGADVDLDSLGAAIKEVFEDKPMKFDDKKIEAVQTALQSDMQARQQKAMAERAAGGEKAKTDGAKFLADNGKREGVTTTKSGLQYEVLKAAEGPKPKVTDTVSVHYKGTLLNGKEFDSSYSRGQPASFPLQGVIPGWTEALQLMSVGSKYKLFLPSTIAYGENGSGPDIGPNETLIFEVELLKIGE